MSLDQFWIHFEGQGKCVIFKCCDLYVRLRSCKRPMNFKKKKKNSTDFSKCAKWGHLKKKKKTKTSLFIDSIFLHWKWLCSLKQGRLEKTNSKLFSYRQIDAFYRSKFMWNLYWCQLLMLAFLPPVLTTYWHSTGKCPWRNRSLSMWESYPHKDPFTIYLICLGGGMGVF